MKKITLFKDLAEILKQPIAGVDFSLEQDEQYCEECGCRLYDSEEMLCTFCQKQKDAEELEDAYFDEKMEIQKEKDRK